MKRALSLVFLVCAVLVIAAFQYPPSSTEPPVPPSETIRRWHVQTLTGTVKSYNPGTHIVVTGSDGAEHAFALDEGARIAEGLADGQSVAVAWFVDSVDQEHVTSIAPFTPGEPDKASAGESSSAPPSKAYASASDGAAMSATPAGSAASTPLPTAAMTPALTPFARTPAESVPVTRTPAAGAH